jgi:mono/diheme cytochrome c family protein
MRPLVLALAAALACGSIAVDLNAQTATRSMTGAEVYASACATCHGADGKGAAQTAVAFDVALPDFTDCGFTTAEAVPDWHAVVEHGGPVRRFNRLMPAFGEALTSDEIDSVIAYIRGFCREGGWPFGDLNLPRPFVTEKAFPENEGVLTTTFDGGAEGSLENGFLYEHRLGSRGQYEINVPLAAQQSADGEWQQGLGDIAVAYKRVLLASMRSGSILSAGGEVALPTGKESTGLGSGVTRIEPFASFSQILPADSFMHVHGGVEFSTDHDRADDETFTRFAVGHTISEPGAGRAWSPMIELLAARELGAGHATEWDVVPQVQVTLSRRQHVMVNIGTQLPLNERADRGSKFLFYLLWDWFDGGLFDGW